MTSERSAYVFVWLPGRVEPVICGRLDERAGRLDFVYARSYLRREEAITLDPEEMPLAAGVRRPPLGDLHGVIRDASPDAWGRRVQEHATRAPLDELDFLLGAGTDRIGALTATPRRELPSVPDSAGPSLEELVGAAETVEAGERLSQPLAAALVHGTSVGGARPKALLHDGQEGFVAKFSSSADHFPVVRAELAAMTLAARCGLDVARTRLVRSLGRDVLLSRRFDRVPGDNGHERRFMVSALTVLRLHETEARLASYLDLAAFIRRHAADPVRDGRELFHRMLFNVLVGNTDDHARNHAFFWDGRRYALTPAYDICPDLRAGRTAYQAMTVGREGRRATVRNALSEAGQFGLSRAAAREAADELVERARSGWPEAAERAGLGAADRERLERETVLGPGCFEA